MYRRYVDDTLLIFNDRDEMLNFFDFMNKQHPSIEFTKEEETNNSLSFLDVMITRQTTGQVVTSVYRKPTFSGLYLK